jgi:hydroxypyruvate isomerase
MPRFSANISFLFCEYPLLERFAAAGRAGFGAVEIGFPYATPVADLKAAKETTGLDMTVINVPAGDLMSGGPGLAAMPGREDEFKRAVETALPYAAALKPGAINVLAGTPPAELGRERCLELLAANAAYAAAAFDGVGVRTVLEAINTRDRPGFLLAHTAESLDLVKRTGHPTLGIEFDIYHMSVMGEDVVASAATCLDKIGNIQFADDPGRHEPGTGVVDFTAIFAGIERAGWRGYFSAEYLPSGKTEDTLGWMKPYLSN